MASDSYVVPGWFVKFSGLILVLMIPWASWVTLNLTKNTVLLENYLKLEPEFEDHKKDHLSRREFDALVLRVAKLEK